jgi:hypothetical protein
MTAFVQGQHQYFVPVLPSRGPDGRGRARTWTWPDSVVEVTPAEAMSLDVDVVVLQRPEELEHLAESWTGRRPGIDVRAVYVEHNTPADVCSVHPAANAHNIPIVHVTHFNACMWDCAGARTNVIEHGVIDPGAMYSGELRRAVAVINEPQRRGRVAGTDLVMSMRERVPIDLFGMCSTRLGGVGELDQSALHREMARRRVYLHPYRWTSLGLSLIEAMFLGMPVVALATTAACESIPPAAGVLSCDLDRVRGALRMYMSDDDAAATAGHAAREHALHRFNVDRFLSDWDAQLREVAA